MLLFRGINKIKISFIEKKELSRWPFGFYFRKVGGVPIDRMPDQDKVRAIAKLFDGKTIFRLTLAPEGTRNKVKEWRTGFYYVALAANMPILPVGMALAKKRHVIDPVSHPTGNIEIYLPRLMVYFEDIEED